MSHEKRKYDSTVARIAGNLLSGKTWFLHTGDHRVETTAHDGYCKRCVIDAVAAARAIVSEVQRTEPERSEQG